MRAAGLTAKQIAFLQSRRIGYLATVDAAGRPHVVPACFVYRQGCVYTPVDAKPKRVPPQALRRVKNILAHPEVSLVVDAYDEDWSRLAWVQMRGKAALVDDPLERAVAIAALRERYPQYRAMPLETCPMIRIHVQAVVEWSSQDKTSW